MKLLRRIPVVLEVIALIGCVFWFANERSLEPAISIMLVSAGILIHIIPGATNNDEKAKHRARLKLDFEKNAVWYPGSKTFGTGIVRHIDRNDSYPQVDKTKIVSPWFRVEIKGIYHSGIEVFLGGRSARIIRNRWQFCKAEDDGFVTVALIGKIPFDLIEVIDWSGDEYYNEPHFYVRFDKMRREPFEEIVVSQKVTLQDGSSYYEKIGTVEEIESKKIIANM